MNPPPARHAFTLIELMIVMTIIAILAAIMMPVISILQDMARRAQCGNNQKQIALAMLAYASETGGGFPVRPTAAENGPAVPAATADPTLTALASLEYLSAFGNGELPPQTFLCPGRSSPRPAAASEAMVSGNATWALRPALGAAIPTYAYDWTVPGNAGATRVILADRPLSTDEGTAHKKKAVATYADGHQLTVAKTMGGSAGGNRTRSLDDADFDLAFNNPETTGDDIYGDLGDGGKRLPGSGSSTRACVW